MSSDAPLNTYDAKKQADNNAAPGVVNQHALSPHEVERICKAVIKHASLIKEQGVQDNARRCKKKMRLSPPQIDLLLQMKWGLTLLGEEKSREYLVWLKEKLS